MRSLLISPPAIGTFKRGTFLRDSFSILTTSDASVAARRRRQGLIYQSAQSSHSKGAGHQGKRAILESCIEGATRLDSGVFDAGAGRLFPRGLPPTTARGAGSSGGALILRVAGASMAIFALGNDTYTMVKLAIKPVLTCVQTNVAVCVYVKQLFKKALIWVLVIRRL